MRDNWYHHWVAGAMLDDQLWHQALVTLGAEGVLPRG